MYQIVGTMQGMLQYNVGDDIKTANWSYNVLSILVDFVPFFFLFLPVSPLSSQIFRKYSEFVPVSSL